MTSGTPRTLQPFLEGLGRPGQRPALETCGRPTGDGGPPDQLDQLDRASLAEEVDRGARRMRARGLGRGEPVGLMGAAGIEWIVACLALLRAGAVPVPLDDQSGDDDLQHILEGCRELADGPVVILCDRRAARRLVEQLEQGRDAELLQLGPAGGGTDEDDDASDLPSWRDGPEDDAPFPEAQPDDRAILFWTSGTTGAPKGVPLTQRHLAYQLDVMREADVLTADDRVLLPLPLHHVYPLVVGVLGPLSLGCALALPHSATGPGLRRALSDGGATLLLGVPGLHRALSRGLQRRVDDSGMLTRAALRPLQRVGEGLRRRLGWPVGRWLLGPLRRRVAPRLRLLLSGGAALDPDLAWRLEGLGWDVATGYGLTETGPLLTLTRPGRREHDSVGLPVRDVELRIDRQARAEDEPDAEGEILARGPGVFDGYLDEERTREAFTDDGWFRTGDLGRLDEHGRLHVTGRVSTLIVTDSGEKLRTEEVEQAYAEHPLIEELGLLETDAGLTAVVVPTSAARRRAQGDDAADEAMADDSDPLRATLGEALEAQGGALPSHQRISRFVVSPSRLERTRLGKLRRHRLKERLEELESSGATERHSGPTPVEELPAPDRELLRDDRARQAWELLAERIPDAPLAPDSRLLLDLGLDSLSWLDLGVELQERTGVELDEARLAEVDTVRDLLEAMVEAEGGDGSAAAPLEDPAAALDARARRRLEPPAAPLAWGAGLLSRLNRALLRVAFRLRVRGLSQLPNDGAVVLAPNHTSFLDPFALAAALPESWRRRTSWAGWTGHVERNALLSGAGRLARVIPVDPRGGLGSGLASAAWVLERGAPLVWFPEGERSRSGELQDFRPGIGALLESQPDVAVVPVRIEGTHEAWPVGRRLPRPGRVTVTFDEPLAVEQLRTRGTGDTDRERIADGLRERVARLAA